MSKRRLFGTDGIRGVANQSPMTVDTAVRLGMALTAYFRRQYAKPRIIIGKDTRRSGYMLENALTAGITSMGGKAYLLGPLPTPSVAYHIRGMRAQGGVMISASHNPFEDNGLKVFQADGFKLSDDIEEQIESLMFDDQKLEDLKPPPARLGKAQRIDDALGRYLVSLKSKFGRNFNLNDMRIVFDGANGAAYECGRKLLIELGAFVIENACRPDGFNINKNCAQEDPNLLGEIVRREKAEIGIAVDGDADRLMLVDENGDQVSGEHLMFEIARHLKSIDRLKANAVVTTSMSNQGMEQALKKEEIECIRTQVGDRYVTAELKARGACFGGENSGHFLFLDQNTTADGLFSALEVLALLKSRKAKASDLHKGFDLFPQKLVSLPVREKRPIEEVKILKTAIEEIEKKYNGNGRVNVRYSGTQSMIRLMVEGPNLSQVETDVGSLASIVEKELG